MTEWISEFRGKTYWRESFKNQPCTLPSAVHFSKQKTASVSLSHEWWLLTFNALKCTFGPTSQSIWLWSWISWHAGKWNWTCDRGVMWPKAFRGHHGGVLVPDSRGIPFRLPLCVQNKWELGNLRLMTSVRLRQLGTLKRTISDWEK
jgi:hypothetical protein